jgi:hypothetical protein
MGCLKESIRLRSEFADPLMARQIARETRQKKCRKGKRTNPEVGVKGEREA